MKGYSTASLERGYSKGLGFWGLIRGLIIIMLSIGGLVDNTSVVLIYGNIRTIGGYYAVIRL